MTNGFQHPNPTVTRGGTYVFCGCTNTHLADVNGEDGVRSRALYIHLSAGSGAGESAQLQTLDHLQHVGKAEYSQ